MTDLRKAAEMALEALEYLNELDIAGLDHQIQIEALRQALAQPEQEPVAWMCENAVGYKYFRWKKPPNHFKSTPLYTAPPSKQWVGLTDAELAEFSDMKLGAYDLCLEVEAKLMEKNT